MITLIAIGIVLAIVLWREVDWGDSEVQFCIAMLFALIAVIVWNIPVSVWARWLA